METYPGRELLTHRQVGHGIGGANGIAPPPWV
jgi:hypothetical protein